MPLPTVTTGQSGHFETVGSGARAGTDGTQPRPAPRSTTQSSAVTAGSGVKTTNGAYLGTFGTPE